MANLASTLAFRGEQDLPQYCKQLRQEFEGLLLPDDSCPRPVLHVKVSSIDEIVELVEKAETYAGFSFRNTTDTFLFWCTVKHYFRLEIGEWANSNDGREVLAELREALSLSQPASTLVSILYAILGYFRLRGGMGGFDANRLSGYDTDSAAGCDTISLADETDHMTECEADSSLISDFNDFVAGRREDCRPLLEKVLPSLLDAMQQQLDTPKLNYFNDYVEDICIQSTQSDQEMEAYFCLRMQRLNHEEAHITMCTKDENKE